MKNACMSATRKMMPALWLVMAATPALAQPIAPDILLKSHNLYREELGITPLTWSDELAKSAQAWADELAASKTFRHSTTSHGENLWMGTANAYSQADMVKNWGDEKKYYVHGIYPKVTTGGVVGHYTQIIWRNTREVGCALAVHSGSEVLVCQYHPAGNWIGQTAY